MSINTARAVQNVALSLLTISPNNMRKAKTIDDEFVESIFENGVIQPLVVLKTGNTFEVGAGRRRLLALQKLAKTKRIDNEHLIPVLVTEDNKEISSLSIAENQHRIDPAQHEYFTAIKSLLAEGMNKTEICKKLCLEPTKFDQIQRLANLHKTIFSAFASDKIDLKQAQAFAASDNRKRQLEVWNQCENPHNAQPHAIRKALLGNLTTKSALSIFVGIQAYTESGGKTTFDLFGDAHAIHDIDLMQNLATQKLAEVKTSLIESQPEWKWCEILDPSSPDESIQIKGRFSPKFKKRTDEQNAQIDVLQKELDALAETDPEDENEELDRRWYELEDLLHEANESIDQANQYFLKREMKASGVVITYDNAGQLKLKMGLQTKEDIKSAKKATPTPATSENNDEEKQAYAPAPSTDYSQALQNDIRLYKRAIHRCELLKHPDLAIELLNYTIVIDALSPMLYGDRFHLINTHKPDDNTSRDDYGESKMNLIIEQGYKKLSLEWLNEDTAKKRIDGFISLKASQKKSILAYVAAITLETDVDSTIQYETAVDYRTYWTPTAENYFSRCPKDKLLTHLEDISGNPTNTELQNGTKKTLASKLSEYFTGKKINKTWVPPLFTRDNTPN